MQNEADKIMLLPHIFLEGIHLGFLQCNLKVTEKKSHHELSLLSLIFENCFSTVLVTFIVDMSCSEGKR